MSQFFDGSPAEVLFPPRVLLLISPIRSEQHLLVDSCESSFYGLSQARVCATREIAEPAMPLGRHAQNSHFFNTNRYTYVILRVI